MTKTNLFPSRVQSSGGHIAKVKAELTEFCLLLFSFCLEVRIV